MCNNNKITTLAEYNLFKYLNYNHYLQSNTPIAWLYDKRVILPSVVHSKAGVSDVGNCWGSGIRHGGLQSGHSRVSRVGGGCGWVGYWGGMCYRGVGESGRQGFGDDWSGVVSGDRCCVSRISRGGVGCDGRGVWRVRHVGYWWCCAVRQGGGLNEVTSWCDTSGAQEDDDLQCYGITN